MTRRTVNALLLAAVGVLVATGALGWLLDDATAATLSPVHRVAGLALLLALAWKYGIALASLTRRLRARDRSVVIGLLAALALVLCLALGVAWSAGALTYDRPWSYSPLNLHVFAGAALVPLVVWHALRRRDAPPRSLPLLTRRAALRLVGLGGAAVALTAAIDAFAPARRHSGSKHAGSFTANAFPLTIWAFDDVPQLDAASWSLGVYGAVARPGRLRYDELAARVPTELDAVLDCTSGWWSEQRWRGAAVATILAERGLRAGARDVDVVSVTGHRWRFSLADLQRAILATHVGGEVLSAGHGHPVRLVVPGRRGYQWVKWVDRLDVV